MKHSSLSVKREGVVKALKREGLVQAIFAYGTPLIGILMLLILWIFGYLGEW